MHAVLGNVLEGEVADQRVAHITVTGPAKRGYFNDSTVTSHN